MSLDISHVSKSTMSSYRIPVFAKLFFTPNYQMFVIKIPKIFSVDYIVKISKRGTRCEKVLKIYWYLVELNIKITLRNYTTTLESILERRGDTFMYIQMKILTLERNKVLTKNLTKSPIGNIWGLWFRDHKFIIFFAHSYLSGS